MRMTRDVENGGGSNKWINSLVSRAKFVRYIDIFWRPMTQSQAKSHLSSFHFGTFSYADTLQPFYGKSLFTWMNKYRIREHNNNKITSKNKQPKWKYIFGFLILVWTENRPTHRYQICTKTKKKHSRISIVTFSIAVDDCRTLTVRIRAHMPH